MSIISISGRMGSGKDEVGKIIQYLTHCKDGNISYEEWQNEVHFSSPEWEIKKFAYKLKQISALILGCKVEDFEDRDFKEKELGPEWDKYLLPVGWYSDIPKYFTTQEEAYKYVDKDYLHKVKKIKMTPRLFLQLAGTDALRNVVHKNIWVNALFADYKKYSEAIIWDAREKKGILKVTQEESMWIITDTRFENELEAVKARGGITIKIIRYPKTLSRCKGPDDCVEIPFDASNPTHLDLWKGEHLHSSETALSNAEFDYTIDNNSDIQSLIKKVKIILEKENIL